MLAAGLLLLALGAGQAGGSAAHPAASSTDEKRRIAERLEVLRREADALNAREKTVLVQLRRLQVDRDIRLTEQRQADASLAAASRELADATADLDALEQREAAEEPALGRRLADVYKLGSGGYLHLLLSVDHAEDVGRAYRTVAALAAMDRERVRAHQSTLASLKKIRADLASKRTRDADAQAVASRAAAAAAGAVTAITALVNDIDARRDLNAQFVGELQTAQQQLNSTVAALPSSGAALPLRPFQGALDWPLAGPVTGRFGRGRATRFGTAVVRNGIEIGARPGTPVGAVHDGTVAFAAPFSGFGNLVILDHGAHAYSLYGYLSALAVTKGDHVDRGARVGDVGVAPAGPAALYFEVRIDGKAVDPLQWLKPRP